MGYRPEEFDDLNVTRQAELLAYEQLRSHEEADLFNATLKAFVR